MCGLLYSKTAGAMSSNFVGTLGSHGQHEIAFGFLALVGVILGFSGSIGCDFSLLIVA